MVRVGGMAEMVDGYVAAVREEGERYGASNAGCAAGYGCGFVGEEMDGGHGFNCASCVFGDGWVGKWMDVVWRGEAW